MSMENLEEVMASRPGKDEYYLGLAEAALVRSTCLRRRYGAIIINNDQPISTGYNGAARGEPNCIDKKFCEREALNIPKGERYELCVAVHAEQNAMLHASRQSMIGGTMYIVGKEVQTGSYADGRPCLICARQIKNSGLVRVVFRQKDGTVVSLDVKEL